ncbi:hypothetical protein SKAU_G00269320 [Synaphobranchus kaupii]|uniref:Uncharacterized protein n=1 Tax=Synaphobranchus kaupii TaxID=118154 RepID=A0A9Q1INE2_SYNKA|nr:hypothetical protein SKAU_G00269320 [Synaphobranchus kaupii]
MLVVSCLNYVSSLNPRRRLQIARSRLVASHPPLTLTVKTELAQAMVRKRSDRAGRGRSGSDIITGHYEGNGEKLHLNDVFLLWRRSSDSCVPCDSRSDLRFKRSKL